MPKQSPKPETVAPSLSQTTLDQVAALDYPLPEYPKLSNGEVGALCAEALEGYYYGERTRYDTSGKKWVFARTVDGTAFYLTVRCSVGPVVLVEAGMPLDRVAGKEGEEALCALVERLAEEATQVANACRAVQEAAQTEVERAAEPAAE